MHACVSIYTHIIDNTCIHAHHIQHTYPQYCSDVTPTPSTVEVLHQPCSCLSPVPPHRRLWQQGHLPSMLYSYSAPSLFTAASGSCSEYWVTSSCNSMSRVAAYSPVKISENDETYRGLCPFKACSVKLLLQPPFTCFSLCPCLLYWSSVRNI